MIEKATEQARIESYRLECVEEFATDLFCNEETGCYVERWLKVKCPGCGRKFAALLSPYTKLLRHVWKWKGDICQEPYSYYTTKCYECTTKFTFGLFDPQ